MPSTVASQIQAQASRLRSQTAGMWQDQGRGDAALAVQIKPKLPATAKAVLAVFVGANGGASLQSAHAQRDQWQQ